MISTKHPVLSAQWHWANRIFCQIIQKFALFKDWNNPKFLHNLFWDAKQYTGLCNSQSRNAQKMNFNYNASLSVVNLVKAWAIKNSRPYPIVSVKTMMYNCFSNAKIYCIVWYKTEQKLK